MNTKILSSLLLLLILASCKEPVLPGIKAGDPFFSNLAIADGQEHELEAGVNDYYLYSSFMQDNQGVYSLQGNLRPRDCSDCGPQLRIVFRDVKVRNTTEKPDPREIVRPGVYDFWGNQQDTVAYETHFQAEINQANSYTYNWDLGDGSTQNQQQFSHRYPTFPTSYGVSLQIEGNNCSSRLFQTIDVPKAGCFPSFKAQSLGSETEFNFSTQPLSGHTYAWDFGDGMGASGALTNHNFPARGAYTVCLLATGSDCQASICRNLYVGAVTGCAVNFSYQTQPIIERDSLGLGQIEVYWLDENGREFGASALPQPASSFFEVHAVEDYVANEKGEPSLAYSFSLKCLLFAGVDEMELEIAGGKMAVAFPE